MCHNYLICSSHHYIKGEETGEGYTEKLLQYNIYRNMLSEYFNQEPDKAVKRIKQFEKEVKKKFIYEPAQMKLLIVVDKLLTDLMPPCNVFVY